MQNDEIIWQVINHGFCSFKVKTPTQNFCREKHNVTGQCNRQSCPLANARYATVLEEDGVCYLFIKTIERAHTPSKMWEKVNACSGHTVHTVGKVKLPRNYAEALALISERLEYWPNFNVHKCKQRLTKIHQYLIRMRRLKLRVRTKLVGIKKKVERREASREAKAERAARLHDTITQELMDRLKAGTYADLYEDVYAPHAIYEQVLDAVAEKEMEEDEEEEEFVAEEPNEVSDEEAVPRKRRRVAVEFEHEEERELEHA